MIRLSPRGKIMYQMLNQVVLLLLLYAIGFLLTALFQHPAIALPPFLTETSIRAFTDQLLKLTILTGFLAAGIAMHPTGPPRVWGALVITAVLLSPFEISLMLDTAVAIFLLAYLGWSLFQGPSSACRQVWQIGILLIALCLLAGHLADPNWAAVIHRFQLHVAYGLCGISVCFWLMTRWSRVPDEWARDGVRIVAALLGIAGGFISIAPLGLPVPLIVIATPLIPLCHFILAGHSYRALSQRNADASLSPHWIALAALYWLMGGGLLGIIELYLRGKPGHLADARQDLLAWVMLAIVLGCVNFSAAELRGGNRRVTGYIPFWLVAFGVGLAAVLQICRGAVELYLREVFALDALDIAALLLPLTMLWMICLLAVAVGIIIYALGFWTRRPQIVVSERA